MDNKQDDVRLVIARKPGTTTAVRAFLKDPLHKSNIHCDNYALMGCLPAVKPKQ
jgi:hypothetical protein